MLGLFRKISYNKRMSKRLGWRPDWFGVQDFDSVLVEKIKAFQESHDLKIDGLCGETTFRRVSADREMMVEPDDSHIIVEGSRLKIPWDKVVSLEDSGNLALPVSCYRSKPRPDPTQIVTHFDVCLSARSCKRVLEKRGISSHFVIDNDGTIYQMVDPAFEAWHAPPANRRSIGIDISNAYYVKYNSTYEKRGHGLRPVLKDMRVHGVKLKECLGFYDVQIEAYKVLANSLCEFYKIPKRCPLTEEHELVRTVFPDARSGKFKGIICHYHLTKKKIDCANLDLKAVLYQMVMGEMAKGSEDE